MSEIAVITATLLRPERARFLEEAYLSLCEQELEWTWYVGVDGPIDEAAFAPDGYFYFFADPRVRLLKAGKTLGAASIRNLLLGQVEEPYVTVLDDDDLLPNNSLQCRLDAFFNESETAGIAWVSGFLRDLGGKDEKWDQPAQPGYYPPGTAMHLWPKVDSPFPLCHACILFSTKALRAVGGWHGLPQGEDLAMLAALTEQMPGRVIDDVVYEYRQHENQSMKSAEFTLYEQQVREIAWARKEALKAFKTTDRLSRLLTQEKLNRAGQL